MEINAFDSVIARVIVRGPSGCYCRLNESYPALPQAFFHGNVEPGTYVLLTVVKIYDTLIFTKLESVIKDAA